MAYIPEIYDWRELCAPIDQVVRAGGSSIPGAMTLGGAFIESPEPGGRYELFMNFAKFATEQANVAASWTISRILNGAIMRIPLYHSVQLVPDALLSDVPTENGIPWHGGYPWENGENWRYSPSAPIARAAAKGSPSLTVDTSGIGDILSVGHVIGVHNDDYDFIHVILDLSTSGGETTLSISPPLRRPLTAEDTVLFRPSALVVCTNAREVMGQFSSGRHMQFNPAVFREALV